MSLKKEASVRKKKKTTKQINNVEKGRLDHHQHKLELQSVETEKHKISMYNTAKSVSNKHHLNNSRGPWLDRGGTSVKNHKERSKIANKYFHSIVGKIQNGIIVSHYIDFLSNSFVNRCSRSDVKKHWDKYFKSAYLLNFIQES